MEERRKSKRLPVHLSAKCLVGSEKDWLNCFIINVSSDGLGIEVSLQEKLPPGLILKFKIIVPKKEEPIETSGILRWFKKLQREMAYIGGVELFNKGSEEARILVDYAHGS